MRKGFFTLLLLLSTVAAMAEGKLTGTVKDNNGEPVMLGNLTLRKIAGTDTTIAASTQTEIDGSFVMEAAAGIYELEVAVDGFMTKVITDIEIKDNQTATANIAITEPVKNDLEEVVIRATIRQENISALYTIQKNSAAVSDGISADVIKKSPDRSTGEVLKRVSGTTIQDNKFVVVRGMSDRYNVALMDNAILPSTEPNRRAFSFDIIPASLIDNIVITKSATPDQPGDFSGGIINILTKEIPDENFNSLSLGLGYNTVSTFNKFQSGYRSSTDFLGFDDGSRKLPENMPSSAKLQSTNYSPEQSAPYLKSLNNDFEIKEHSALPAINFQGSLGRIYNMKKDSRFGFTAALSYNHNESYKRDVQRLYDNYDYKDNQYTYSTNLGALLNMGYYYKNSKITLKTIYNRTFDDNFLYRTGTNNSSGSDVQYYAFDLLQKSLFKTTLAGEHQAGKKSKLNWLLSYNYITNSQPDQRKVLYARQSGTDDVFKINSTTLGKENSRLFSNMSESITNGALNYSTPISWFKQTTFKAGVFGQYRYRNFANRYLGFVSGQNFEDQRALTIQDIFSDKLIDDGMYTIQDQTNPSDKYDASSTTGAAYVMMDNKFTDQFRAVYGVRAEQFNYSLTSDKKTYTQSWLDLLPSVNLTYAVTDLSNLRLSYFRSVARPEMRELANLFYYDYELSANIYGNPDLKRSRIDNFDFRYEYYPQAGEVLSASVFYKRFANTLENYVNSAGSAYEINIINYPSATNMGAEVEVRKRLDFISKDNFFKNITAYLNIAYTYSKVDSSSITVNDVKVNDRPLMGQSPLVINASLGYTSDNGKWNATILYNRIAQRLYFVGGGRLGHVYETPRNLLDFQLSYALSQKSELRLNVKDILNNPVQFYFDQDGNQRLGDVGFNADGSINTKMDWILQKYQPGTTISLTYSLKL